MDRIECIENEIVGFLHDLKPMGIDVIPTPENMAEFVQPSIRPKVTAIFSHTKFERERSTSDVLQDEWLMFDIVIQSRIIRGKLGAHDIYNMVRKRIHGRTSCTAGDKFVSVHYVPYNENTPQDVWTYVYQVKVRCMVVEAHWDFTEEPVITEINFDLNAPEGD